ncbi:MAG: hypothetical protein ACFFDI_23815 [Promethearchaeota archaeon]
MPANKSKNRRRKADKIPPELYMEAQIAEETAKGVVSVPLRLRRPAEGELFAIVLKKLGDNRFRVQCSDGRTRIARLRGELRKRKWVRQGDAVLVEPWYGLDEETKADLTHRYLPREKRVLEGRELLKNLEEFL